MLIMHDHLSVFIHIPNFDSYKAMKFKSKYGFRIIAMLLIFIFLNVIKIAYFSYFVTEAI
jgi:hypothetical protein